MGFSVFGVMLVVGILAGAVVASRRWARGPATNEGLSADVPPTESARRLVVRWRDRARRWRTTAGLSTVVAVVGIGLVVRQEVRLGIGGGPLWADPIACGLGAAFAGAIGAEMHHLRRRPSGPRTVSLRPREVAGHLWGSSRRRLVVLAGACALAVSAHLLIPAANGSPIAGLLGLLVGASVVLVQRSIVARPRPALPEDLTAADDAIRGLAIRSVDAAGAGLVLLLLLWQLTQTGAAVGGGGGVLSLLLGLAYIAGLALAVIWWRRGAPDALVSRGASSGTDAS